MTSASIIPEERRTHWTEPSPSVDISVKQNTKNPPRRVQITGAITGSVWETHKIPVRITPHAVPMHSQIVH